MAPKRASRNGFYFYMVEVKGAKKITMTEASRIAGVSWSKMNAQQRAPYDQMACANKNGVRGERYTTEGIPFTVIDAIDKEKKDKLLAMKADISRILRKANDSDMLGVQDFYIIDINVFCSTLYEYVPAELAVSCFNLNNGVHRIHHTLINPGFIPIGYRGEATALSEESHQLKLPPDALGESDYLKIYTDLLTFILENDGTAPLYTLPKYIEQVEGVISQICNMFDVNPEQFKIYSLDELLFQMANLCAEQSGSQKAFITNSDAEFQLLKDVYDFYIELTCEYHKNTDAVAYCSLSRVKRFAYLITDFCCQHLDIELIPGKHIPKKANASKLPSLQLATVDFDSDNMSITSQSETLSDVADNTSSTEFRDRPCGLGSGKVYRAVRQFLLSQRAKRTGSSSSSTM